MAKKIRFGFSNFLVARLLAGVAVLWVMLASTALALGEDSKGFWIGAVVLVVLQLPLLKRAKHFSEPTRGEALTTTSLLWLVVPFLGAIPYWVSGGLGFIDGWFESVSGFTTTGSSVLGGEHGFGYTLMLWRSLSQWIGGIGVMVMLAGVLGRLGLAGRELFSSEGPKNNRESTWATIRSSFALFMRSYLVITLLCAAAFGMAGLPWFEAACAALATVSTGGFTVSTSSFIATSAAVQWVAIVFMFLAGANLVTLVRLVLQPFSKRQFKPWTHRPVLQEIEFWVYVAVVALLWGLLSWLLMYYGPDAYTADAVRHALFTVVSVASTTGFVSSPINAWAPAAQVVVLLCMLVGGTIGSAAGGIKVIRMLVVGGIVRRELFRAVHPSAVLPLRLGQKLLSDDVRRSVSAFMTIFAATLSAGGFVVSVLENDFVLGFSSVLQALSNIGPSLSAANHVVQGYQDFHPASKLVLMGAMWAGRLELIPVFALLMPELRKALR